jgi:hypothetical protein
MEGTHFLNILSLHPPESNKDHTSALTDSTSNHQTWPHLLLLGIEPDVFQFSDHFPGPTITSLWGFIVRAYLW